MIPDLDKCERVLAGKQSCDFSCVQKWRNARDSPGSGLRQASHREMDEDVCSGSRTPSSPGFFFFF